MDIVQLIPDYLDYCHYQKNLSADTLKAYRIDLNQFAVYWAGTDGAPTRGNLAQYVVVLQKQFQPRTARRKTASVKAFFGWLIYMELVEFDPFQKLRVKFNEPKILPRTIPLTLIAQLLSAVYQAVLDGELMALRDAAVLELLFASGMRVSELCALPSQAVDLEQGNVLIYGKGARERIIQIGNQDVLTTLRRYYSAFEEKIRAENRFFINRMGRKYSDQSVRAMIRKYLTRIENHTHVTPHMFRHTFATQLLEADVDLRYIQSLLGHSSISTTQIYTHVTVGKQRDILSHKHPRNGLKINYG